MQHEPGSEVVGDRRHAPNAGLRAGGLHPYAPEVELDVAPVQPSQFSAAHPAKAGQSEGKLNLRVGHLEHCLHFRWGENLDLFAADFVVGHVANTLVVRMNVSLAAG